VLTSRVADADDQARRALNTGPSLTTGQRFVIRAEERLLLTDAVLCSG
jgi:hypothetical protein